MKPAKVIPGYILIQHIEDSILEADEKTVLTQNINKTAVYTTRMDKANSITNGCSRLCELDGYLSTDELRAISKLKQRSMCVKQNCIYENRKNNSKCCQITEFQEMYI